MIDRSLLSRLLSEDFDGSFPYSEGTPEKFAQSYQLERLHSKENNGSVLKQHIEESFSSFKASQAELKTFAEDFPTLLSCFPKEMHAARLIISGLLPPLDFVEDEVFSLCCFGPGSFFGYEKKSPVMQLGYSTHYKVGGPQTVTPMARNLALDVISKYFPHWREFLTMSQVKLSYKTGNKLAYVVKHVRACRPIAIEPSLNVFLQQGVGRWLGQHLRKVGFADIYDGQAVQRHKASFLTNATIDLSNASDTISLELCRFLLPSDWFHLLNTIRSHTWSKDQESGTYENISSQGNAFTFPLQTMIFKSICLAFSGLEERKVTVYGDDIIVPIASAESVVNGLELCGFTVNKEKSYYGQHDDERFYFRESCGADYYKQLYVTPVYYRENATTYQQIATLYNRLYERWGFLPNVHNYLISLVPEREILWGPSSFVTDNPTKWIKSDDTIKMIPLRGSLNSVVRVYSSWFWISEFHNFPNSGKRWSTKPRKISRKNRINEYSSYMAFLLGDQDTVPRLSDNVVTNCDTFELSSETGGLPKWGAAKEIRSF